MAKCLLCKFGTVGSDRGVCYPLVFSKLASLCMYEGKTQTLQISDVSAEDYSHVIYCIVSIITYRYKIPYNNYNLFHSSSHSFTKCPWIVCLDLEHNVRF